MTYNTKTNILQTRGVYIDIHPMDTIKHPYGYFAKVSDKLYKKLKVGKIIYWYKDKDSYIRWNLLITRKAKNTIWFYLP